MTGLDTHVPVRYVMQDDAKQSARATEWVEALTVDSPGFVPLVAVIEFAWVLPSAYGLDRSQLVAALEGLDCSPPMAKRDRRHTTLQRRSTTPERARKASALGSSARRWRRQTQNHASAVAPGILLRARDRFEVAAFSPSSLRGAGWGEGLRAEHRCRPRALGEGARMKNSHTQSSYHARARNSMLCLGVAPTGVCGCSKAVCGQTPVTASSARSLS